MSEHMEMPTLLFWENGNVWYGSKGNTRFFIQPVKHDPPEDQPEGEPRYTLDVEVWPGPLTKSLSQITATNSFPRTLEVWTRWSGGWRSRPKRTTKRHKKLPPDVFSSGGNLRICVGRGVKL